MNPKVCLAFGFWLPQVTLLFLPILSLANPSDWEGDEIRVPEDLWKGCVEGETSSDEKDQIWSWGMIDGTEYRELSQSKQPKPWMSCRKFPDAILTCVTSRRSSHVIFEKGKVTYRSYDFNARKKDKASLEIRGGKVTMGTPEHPLFEGRFDNGPYSYLLSLTVPTSHEFELSGQLTVSKSGKPIQTEKCLFYSFKEPRAAYAAQAPNFDDFYRNDFGLAALPGGKALVIGGNSNDRPASRCLLLDPSNNTIQPTFTPKLKRGRVFAHALKNGQVLVGGPSKTHESPTEVLDSMAGSSRILGKINTGRSNPFYRTVYSLKNGNVLILSSDRDTKKLRTFQFDINKESWVELEPRPLREDFGGIVLKNGELLVVGGSEGYRGKELTSTELFDPKTQKWRSGPSLRTPRVLGDIIQTAAGEIVVFGGYISNSGNGSIEVLDQEKNSWASYKGPFPFMGFDLEVLQSPWTDASVVVTAPAPVNENHTLESHAVWLESLTPYRPHQGEVFSMGRETFFDIGRCRSMIYGPKRGFTFCAAFPGLAQPVLRTWTF